jgi:hypothetical protein
VNEWEITPVDLKKKLDAGETPFILDVREPNEYQINRIAGSTLIPLGSCRGAIRSCRAIARSWRTARWAAQREGAGFPQVGRVHEREEPQGRDSGMDRQGRPQPAQVLNPDHS